MDPDKETTRAGITGLAATAFEKRERVKMLEMMNTPTDYEERKKAFVELELARHEANQAEAALRLLNPQQNLPPFNGNIPGYNPTPSQGLSGYTQQGLGPRVCICGFVSSGKPQSEWTDEECKAEAAHQDRHLQARFP